MGRGHASPRPPPLVQPPPHPLLALCSSATAILSFRSRTARTSLLKLSSPIARPW